MLGCSPPRRTPRAGVPPAGYIAFISAAPVLDPVLFGALWLIVGPTVAVIYVVVTLTVSLGLALGAQHIGIERHLKPVAEPAPVHIPAAVGGLERPAPRTDAAVSPDARVPWDGWTVESRRALRASSAPLRSFGPLLLLGIAIGIAIEAVV